MKKPFTLLMLILVVSTSLVAQTGWRKNEMEVRVDLPTEESKISFFELNLNADLGSNHATAYVVPIELDQIQKAGLKYKVTIKDLTAHYQDFWLTEDAYHSYSEIVALADSLVNAFPSLCEKYLYGSSLQGRQLCALKISDNVDVDEPEPEVMFDGGIHGDEIGAAENVIRFARDILLNYGSDPYITGLINNREIWLYYMVNPDGRVNMSRYNANGVDLNRDWGYMWDAWGGSSGAYSQVESKALRECMYSNQFVVHTTYHSGTEYISCPWSYRSDQCPDFGHIYQLAGVYSSVSGYSSLDYGQGNSGMYAINGSTKDGNYGTMGAISWSMEISYSKQPPASQIMTYYNRNRPSMLAMIEYAGYGLQGTVTDSITGEPITANVFVNNYYPTYTDPTCGDFHKYVLPGTYSIEVVANGYQSKTINNVSVSSGSATTVDCQLNPQAGHYVYRFSASQIPDNNESDEGNTPAVIGEPDFIHYSIGKNGWCVLDMQYPVTDGPGNDLTVYEGDGSPEGFTCFAGPTIDGPWTGLGAGTGTTGFDLAAGGLSEAQFIRIVDDGDGPQTASDAGFDLDAIEAEQPYQGVYLLVDHYDIDDNTGNNNGHLDPGETAGMVVTLKNNGSDVATGVTGNISISSPYLSILNASANFGDIQPGMTSQGVFTISASPSTPIGYVGTFDCFVSANGGSYTENFDIDVAVGLIFEDWESGNFSQFFWQFDGNANWLIDSSDPYEGSYCVKSGNINDNQISELFVSLNISQAGTISFWRKVSSESGYDFLQFYIDGVSQGIWSGTLGWNQESYSVNAGVHTFRWVYSKDGGVSSGSDCAWIDYIIFPPVGPSSPSISVAPSSIDFGDVFVGDVYTQNFTITNDGTDLLTGTITTPNGFSVAASSKDNLNDNKSQMFVSDNSINYSVYPGVNKVFDLSFSPTAIQTYSGDVVITHNATGGDINIAVTGDGINGLPLPYTQDFEAGGVMPYAWTNETVDDFDWTTNSGGTPSNNTGPGGDHTTGSGYYVYTESSSPNYPNKHAYLNTPIFDIGNNNDVEMKVWYHMYGASMGTLHVDAYNSGTWHDDVIAPISGDQGNQWHELTVDLSAFTGTIKLRFRAITGSSYTSDIALDDFHIQHIVTNPVIVVNPASLDFGDVPVGGSSAMQFTIENTGTGALSGDITTPIGFTVSQAEKNSAATKPGKATGSIKNTLSYTVPESTVATFDVVFEPQSTQTYSGNIDITSNDPGSPVVYLAVSGSGVAPADISVNPASFSVTLPPDDLTTELLEISNSGSADLNFTIDIEEVSAGFIDRPKDLVIHENRPNLTDELDKNSQSNAEITLPGVFFDEGKINKGEEVFGGWSNTWSGGNRDRGNIFHVITTTNLQEVRCYLDISNSTELYFAVYEGDASSGTFALKDQVHIPNSGTGEGWYSSGSMDVVLESGKYYYICTAWLGTATYGRGDETVPIATSFGELLTGVPSTTAGFPPASSVSSNHTGFSPYYQTIVTGTYTPDWLIISPDNGTVSTGQTFNVDIEINSAGLSEGVYLKNLLVNSNDPDQPVISIPVTLTVSSGIFIDLKAYLEGPFNSNEMETNLIAIGDFPMSQPFNVDPWYYNGSESISSIPNSEVVDWILVELRETPGDAATATGTTMIGRKAAFILSDGRIASMDGASPLIFNVSVTQNLFAVVWHRNHLGILSNYSLTESGGVYAYDFTTDADKVYGSYTGHKQIVPGAWGMVGGDGNCDGQITNADKNEEWSVQAGSLGYLSGDFDLDANVNNSDKNQIWVPNSGNGSQVPDGILGKGYHSQVPE